MRIAMKQGSTLTYLHSDHLGSTVLETNTAGTVTADQKYRAYGKQRDTGAVVTDHKFTGQKLDGTGLQYYNARYYDPAMGVFISPDAVVPDATNVFDYNRYMYVRGNPLKLVDASGHEPIHHSNYPCSYTACVRDGGNLVSVSQWTPELHQRYYGAGSQLEQELPTVEEVHLALDAAGTVDPTGIADGLNGAIYLVEGNYVDAGLSALAVLPLGDLAKGARYADEGAELLSHADSFDEARRLAFEYAGMMDPSQVKFTKVDPVTGTVVEFKGPGGAKVAYDSPHISEGAGHEMPHVGWQTGGKRSQGGTARGNITYDGPQHPYRSPVKGIGEIEPY